MNERFEVGEIAIAARPADIKDHLYHGQDVEVIEPLRLRAMGFDGKRHYAYIVRTQDGKRHKAIPRWLKKKPPKQQPREVLGEWELCPWQPTHSTVSGGGNSG